MRKPVIAIDGPAGAGKSTVSKILASRLGLGYLDTGAMYRCVALKALHRGIAVDNEAELIELAIHSEIEFLPGDPQKVMLDGEDVTSLIRTLEIGEMASALSVISGVRRALVAKQKEIVAHGGYVLEGRDATTVIAPDAEVKVFLTASLEERARRRHAELAEKGLPAGDYGQVRKEVESRDHRDIHRDESPLTVAEGAHLIESGGHDIEAVVDKIIALMPG